MNKLETFKTANGEDLYEGTPVQFRYDGGVLDGIIYYFRLFDICIKESQFNHEIFVSKFTTSKIRVEGGHLKRWTKLQ